MRVPRRDTPVFNDMPATIVWLAVIMVGVHIIGWLLPTTLQAIYQTGAILPAFVMSHPSPLGPWSPWLFHVFVHGGWAHLILNTMAMLAFGTATARPFGASTKGVAGFVAFYFVCAIAGAGVHVLANPGSMSPMIGASTALSGCIAAAGWARGGAKGMLGLAVPWLLFNVVIAVVGTQIAIPIAWAGHIGGLVAGAILYPFFLGLFGPAGR